MVALEARRCEELIHVIAARHEWLLVEVGRWKEKTQERMAAVYGAPGARDGLRFGVENPGWNPTFFLSTHARVAQW
jgi:hypothetical protein